MGGYLGGFAVEVVVGEGERSFVEQIECRAKNALRADVFEQNDATAGFYHASQFPERKCRIGDGAKDESRKSGVELIFAERQTLGVGLYQMIFAAFTGGHFQHPDGDLAGHSSMALRVKFEVRSGPAAYLENIRIFRQQINDLLTPTPQPEAFERSEGTVVISGELVVDGWHVSILPILMQKPDRWEGAYHPS